MSRKLQLSRRPLRALRAGGLAVAALAAGAGLAQAQPAGPQRGQAMPAATQGFQRVRIADSLYVVHGPDGNVVVQFGPDGAAVVDTQRDERGQALLNEINSIIGPRQIRFLFNTSADVEHTGANQLIREAGEQVFGGNVAGQASDLADEAAHLAHENVLLRMSETAGVSDGDWPKETYATNKYDLYFNGQGVQLFHEPSAHTNGDSIVYFRGADVLVAGDLWDTTSYPRIDTAAGGSINGVLAGLNHMIDLAIPSHKQEGGTMVVPGRGRVGDESDLVEYRDMVTIIRDRIKAMADRGMSLEQVKAARPSFDYDGRYGAATGPWTTDMFITAVYEGVKPQRRGR
jgi:glyoxylase-like metal-dependent hydrolase (beta-lactamase superfamily II)